MAEECNLAPHQGPRTWVAPLVEQGLDSPEIKVGPSIGPVRTGKLGRLQDRPKLAKVAEKF